MIPSEPPPVKKTKFSAMSSVPYTATANYQETGELRIALVGGGTGGLSLAIGLLKYPHIDVHIYEAAPSSSEIGAGVALGPNAQRALKLIGPDIMEAFRKHATGNMWVSHANRFAQHVVVCSHRVVQCLDVRL